MSDPKIVEAGAEIEAMCWTCKDATVHVVEVIKDNEPTKVLCKSCNKSHKYRPPVAKGEEKPKKKAAAKKAPPKTKEQRKWSRVMSKVDTENPQDYSMSDTYENNAVIAHKKFGVGVVSEVVDPTKVTVVFEEGIKTMVHNRS